MNHENDKNERLESTPEISDEVKAAAKQAEQKAAEEKEKKDKKKSREKGEKKTLKQHLTSERFKHGTMATALTAVFLVAVVLVNVLVGILGDRFPSINLDMTKNSENSLSEEAAEIVDTVDEPTEIYIMMDQESAESSTQYQTVISIASRMAERNSNITLQFKDPDTDPGFLAEYSSDNLRSGDVLVRTDKRYRIVTSSDLFPTSYDQNYNVIQYTDVNGALATAVNAVNVDTMPVAAFDTGHSEMINTTSYKDLLTENNFDTVDFNLLTEEIPEDAQMIVLAVPSTDLTSDEVEKLNTWLNDASAAEDRSLIVVAYPTQGELPTLNSYLNEWGLNVTPSQVLEGDPSNYIQSPDMIIANVDTELDLGGETTDYGYVVTPQSNPVEILWEGRNSVTTYPLLTTSDSAYIYDMETQTELTDDTGTRNLAAAGVKMIKHYTNDYRNSSVVVIGSAFMFDSTFTASSTFGNSTYLADLSKYLTGTTGSTSAIFNSAQQMITYDIVMSNGQITFLGLGVFTILIPIAFLVSGIVVFFRRRHL